MSRPREHTHLARRRVTDGLFEPACGIFGGNKVMATDPADVDCGHCIRIRDKRPHPNGASSKNRWADLKAIAAASRSYVAAVRANAGADRSSWEYRRAELDHAWHDLLVALGECDMCDEGTCPGEVHR